MVDIEVIAEEVICNQAGSHACADDCPHGKTHTAHTLIDCTREVECVYLDFIDTSSVCHCEPIKKPLLVQHEKSGCTFIAHSEEGRQITGAIVGDKLMNVNLVTLACLESYKCELCDSSPVWNIDGSIGRMGAVSLCSGCLRKMADYLDDTDGRGVI